jgi:hypothetical protein
LETLERQEYDFSVVPGEEGAWSAPNRAQALRSRVSANGVEIFPRTTGVDGVGATWKLGLRTCSVRRGERELPLSVVSLRVEGGSAILDRGAVVERIHNRANGIEQMWNILGRPDGEGPLTIELELSGGFVPEVDGSARSARLVNPAVELPYGGLRSFDSNGRDLPARFVTSGAMLVIEVDDECAPYPLTVDPTLAWTAEGDQAGAGFGYSVASAGDVNGDGFDDVLVGAYLYDNGEMNEGRAFLYLGSASGLGATPVWTAESNQEDAEFGYSVAGAGDVNGDTFADVIISARLYDFPEPDEGAAFVFHGPLSGSASVASANWMAESDQAGAMFGYSVAGVGDVDDDSYSDVIIGAPDYDNPETNEGAAFVWLGSSGGLGVSGTPSNADWRAESDQSSGGLGAGMGWSVAGAGDVNGDGKSDAIVGAFRYSNGELNEGRAFVYHGPLSGQATTADWTRESNQAVAYFGFSVSGAGDVDGNGYDDVIVGIPNYDNPESEEGAASVYLGSVSGLSLTAVWTGQSHQGSAFFGYSVATAGDVNGDGYADILVGAPRISAGETEEGRAYLYRGSASGPATSPTWTVDSDNANARFGSAVSSAGDVNGDGYGDFILGANQYSNPQSNEGAAFVYLGEPPFREVLYHQKISATEGGLSGVGGPEVDDSFGVAIAGIGDLDDDGVEDIAVGAVGDDDGVTNAGAVWILFLSPDGTVKAEQKISATAGGFGGMLDNSDQFGKGIAGIGDLDGDGVEDLAVSAYLDDDGGTDYGAVWVLFLNSNGTVDSYQKISDTAGGFMGTLEGDGFGVNIASLDDLDGDGVDDLAVGEYADGVENKGAVWILFLNPDGTVKDEQKISDTEGGFGGFLEVGAEFGYSVAGLEMDGLPGTDALLVGERGDGAGGDARGAAWFLFLNSDGTVAPGSEVKITEGLGGFSGDLDDGDYLGSACTSLGRSTHAFGVVDVAISAYRDDDGVDGAGAVWILALDQTGRVVAQEKISATQGRFSGTLDVGDNFGLSVALLGDIDGDGRNDIGAGAIHDDDGGTDVGAAWVLFLNDGTLRLGANATTWTGATDTQWELASNWSNGLPDATKTAIIPDTTTDPLVSVVDQACDSLWIQQDGILSVASGIDLGIHGGATVIGPSAGPAISGMGRLVFEESGILAGASTIDLPDVVAEADIEFQGGLLTMTGDFRGVGTAGQESDLLVHAGSRLLVEGRIEWTGNLVVEGDLEVDLNLGGTSTVAGDATIAGLLDFGALLEIGNQISSTVGSSINGSELTVGGPVLVGGYLIVGRLNLEGPSFLQFLRTGAIPVVLAQPFGGELFVATGGIVTLDAVITGSVVLVSGQLQVVQNSVVATIEVRASTLLDVTDRRLTIPGNLDVYGELHVGPGGELVLGIDEARIQCGGVLSLVGRLDSPAVLTSEEPSGFDLVFESSCGTPPWLEAQYFVIENMSAAGFPIPSNVTIAPPPLDVRNGAFDGVRPNGRLLDVERSLPTKFLYLAFRNSDGSSPASNVRVSAGSPVTLVNWTGGFGGEAFDDDAGEDKVLWASRARQR